MKKIYALLLAVLICLTFATFAACEPEQEPTTYTVTFKNGDTVIKTVSVNEGECVTELPTCEVTGDQQFDGWFVSDTPFTTETVITSDTIVTAKISAKSNGGNTTPDTGDEKFVLTLKLDTDTVYETVKGTANTKVDLYSYSVMDYEIHEWVDSNGKKYAYTDLYTIVGNATLTAVNPIKTQFTMKQSSNGAYYIVTGLFDTLATTATVPETYFGLPVKEIAAQAFAAYNNTLKELVIPNTIEKIGAEAFSGLYGLQKLTVPFIGAEKHNELFGNGIEAMFAFWFAEDVSLDYRPKYVHGYSFFYNGDGTEIDENGALAERYIPKSLTDLTVNGGAIANYAFHTITTIETISFGDEVTALGKHAFSVNPQGTDTPSAEYKLKNVLCGQNSKIASIGEYCFGNQVNLEKVFVGPKVKVIPESLFRGYSKLAEIKIFENSELEEICDNAFYGAPISSIFLPDTLTTIGVHAFSTCNELTEVNVPKNAVNLEGGIFRGCENLTTVTFAPQSNLTEVPSLMFAGCSNLKTVKLPAAIVEFGVEAFSNCRSLSKLDDDEVGFALEYVTYIGDGALASTGFKYITISEDITYIGGGAFSGCAQLVNVEFNDLTEDCPLTEIRSYTFDGCKSLKSIELPDSVTKIGDRAFAYTSLQEVTLSANIVTIGDRAFLQWFAENDNTDDYKLTTITNWDELEKLVYIGDSAFMCNYNLEITMIPQSVQKIGASAFRNTKISGTITIDPTQITEIGEHAFAECKNAVLQVMGTQNDIPRKWKASWAGVGESATTVKFTGEANDYRPLFADFEGYEEDDVCYVTKYVGLESDIVLEGSYLNKTVVYCQNVFAGNKLINSLTLAPNMTTIPNGFCSECKNLTTVIVPEQAKITKIGNYAFNYCSLTSFTMDASELTEIGDYAFYGNSEMTRVTLTNNNKIERVGDYAFQTWHGASGTKLAKLDLDLTKAAYIGDYAFGNNAEIVAEYVLTSATEYLGEGAFRLCRKIKLTLKDGFTTTRFENEVFSQLGTLIWENPSFEGVEYIGDNAFSSAGGTLRNAKISIPNTVTYIGKSAFHQTKLAGAVIDCNSDLEIGDTVFGYSADGFYVVIKGTPKKIGYAICSTTNNAHIYFTETITVSTTYPRVFTLGDSDCAINNMFYIYNEDYTRATNIPYFGAGQWETDENGEPIHPTDGHTESHS